MGQKNLYIFLCNAFEPHLPGTHKNINTHTVHAHKPVNDTTHNMSTKQFLVLHIYFSIFWYYSKYILSLTQGNLMLEKMGGK